MIAERCLADYPKRSFHAEDRRLRLAAYYTVNGEVVRELRIRNKMTQDKLRKAAGVSKQTIVRMEGETHTPQFASIEKVAVALGVEADAIIVYHTPGSETLPGQAQNATDLREGLNSAAQTRGQHSGDRDDREADRNRGA